MNEDKDKPANTTHRFTLRQLTYLVELADAGSFATAAARLHLSPSAMAVAVSELERMLGLQLTVRRRAHGVTLTPAGRQIADQAQRVLLEADRLTELPGDDVQVRGTVHLGCYTTLAPSELPDLLDEFGRRFPESTVQLIEAGQDRLTQLLLAGELDAAIMYNLGLDKELRKIKLSRKEIHILLPEAHPLASRQELSIRELAGEPMILLDLPPASENAMAICKAAGVTPQIRYRAMTLELTRALVGRGLGYALLAQRAPGRLTGTGRAVATLKLADPAKPLDVVLVLSPLFPVSKATSALIGVCRELSRENMQ